MPAGGRGVDAAAGRRVSDVAAGGHGVAVAAGDPCGELDDHDAPGGVVDDDGGDASGLHSNRSMSRNSTSGGRRCFDLSGRFLVVASADSPSESPTENCSLVRRTRSMNFIASANSQGMAGSAPEPDGLLAANFFWSY